MRSVTIALLFLVAGCVAAPAPEISADSSTPGPPPPPAPPARPARTARLDPPIAGYQPDRIREEVERNVAERLGAEALRLAASAATSIMVSHHQGLPRPVQNPDGSWGYDPPGANAMVLGSAGWIGWSGQAQRPVAAARAAEIDRIFADPRFWAEPDYVRPTCTDAGARRMVIRHRGRTAVRQQSCAGRGLTNRLWELVYGGPG